MAAFLPRSVRTIGRLQAVAMVLTRHGFGHLVDSMNLARYVPFLKRLRAPGPPAEAVEAPHAVGRRIARVCEELGPTYVKLAQMASSRPDLLPPEIISELRTLQDRVAPFDSDQARQIIEEDLGVGVDETFRAFEPEPLASGSIGQVYRAETADGQRVVVKVRRPGIDEVIALDMHILRWLAERLERALPDLARYHPSLIIDEFEHTVTRELDFVNEAAATARFHEAFREDDEIAVPEVRWDLTGGRVLTLTWITGTPVQRVIDDPDSPVDRKALAHRLAEAFLRQYFDLNMFHADPHPGNLLIAPPARVGLIDFGMIGQVDDELAGQLVISLLAAVNKEVDLIVDVMADLGATGPETDRRQLARGLRELLDKYYGMPLKRLELQTIFAEVTELVRRHDVTLPRDFVMLGKSLVTVAGVALQLDPELNLLQLIRPRVRDMLAKRISPRRLLRATGMSAWHLINIAKTAPRQLRDALRGLSRGQWQLNVQHQNLDYLANEIDRASNRIAFSVVIGATILGSSILFNVKDSLFGLEIRYLAIAGYVIAGIMGLGLVIAILRSGKLS